MGERKRFFLYLYGGITLLVMVLIFLLSAQDSDESGSLSAGFLASMLGRLLDPLLPRLTGQGMEHDIRKYAHMFEYLCLGIRAGLFFSEWNRPLPRRFWRSFVSAFVFCLAYASLDELHQVFVPGRAGRLTDVLIDGIGFTTGAALTAALANRSKPAAKT